MIQISKKKTGAANTLPDCPGVLFKYTFILEVFDFLDTLC